MQSFARGVHLIAGGRGKGSDYAPLAGPVAEHCAAVYLIGETAAALRDALEPTGVPLHDSQDLARAVEQAHASAREGRRRPALAGLRVLRPIPLLRGARGPFPDARERAPMNAGRRPARGVEWRSDGPSEAAAAGAPPAAHRHVLPAGRRRGDGLLGLVRAHAAPGPGRRHAVPAQVRRLRGGRADRDVRRLAPEPRLGAPLHGPAADRRVRDARAGQDPGHRREGQRRAPLARRRAAPVPAQRDHEARADPAHRPRSSARGRRLRTT